MLYEISLICAVVFFIASLVFAGVLFLLPYKQRRIKPFYILTGGVFLSATTALYSLYEPLFRDGSGAFFNSLLSAFHNAIRMYVVDCDISFVLEQTEAFEPAWRYGYLLLFAVLLVFAPLLTASALLSFFGGLIARVNYAVFYFFADTYVFSELNERSLSLAKSICRDARRRPAIIFTGTTDRTSELYERAKALRPLFFNLDIAAVNLRFHSKRTKLYFFVIGEDEENNINDVISLASPPVRKRRRCAEANGERPRSPLGGYDYPRGLTLKGELKGDTRVYLFSLSKTTERRLDILKPTYLKIRRINDVQSLVYNLLYREGSLIFDSAKPTGNTIYNPVTGQNDPEKKIHALVLGLGLHGTELVKALAWFGQMHPYRLEIDAFDMAEDASSRFHSAQPELFDCNPQAGKTLYHEDGTPFHNGDFETPGEAHYRITIHDKADALSQEFDEMIAAMKDVSYVFIALGDDERNVLISTKMRILFRRLGYTKDDPIIHTIVYNENAQKMLAGTVAVGQEADSYNIRPLGDISSTYTTECVLSSALEKFALSRHMRYADKSISDAELKRAEEKKPPLTEEEKTKLRLALEESFWSIDYNYRSSLASAIHYGFKKTCHLPGADKDIPSQRTMAEREFYCMTEHRRWNAFVRSEGHIVTPLLLDENGQPILEQDTSRPDDKVVMLKKRAPRDRLAKTHPLLVPYDELSYKEQIKDED